MFPDKSDPIQDRLLVDALARSGNVTLAYLPRSGAQDGKYEDVRPLAEFRQSSKIGTIGLRYNYANEGWLLPRGTRRGMNVIPSLASILADQTIVTDKEFRVNYAFDPGIDPYLQRCRRHVGTRRSRQAAGQDDYRRHRCRTARRSVHAARLGQGERRVTSTSSARRR